MNKDKKEANHLSKIQQEFIETFGLKSPDLERIKDGNIAKIISIKEHNIKEENTKAVEFCFWFCYFIESLLQKNIAYIEKKGGTRKKFVDVVLDKSYFRDKIDLYKELYFDGNEKEKIIKMLLSINNLRNYVAHGKFDKLIYKESHLYEMDGQLKIMTDFMKALEAKR